MKTQPMGNITSKDNSGLIFNDWTGMLYDIRADEYITKGYFDPRTINDYFGAKGDSEFSQQIALVESSLFSTSKKTASNETHSNNSHDQNNRKMKLARKAKLARINRKRQKERILFLESRVKNLEKEIKTYRKIRLKDIETISSLKSLIDNGSSQKKMFEIIPPPPPLPMERKNRLLNVQSNH